MKLFFDGKTGDLYPTGDLRNEILNNRIAVSVEANDRHAWRKAPSVVVDTWNTELYGSFSAGDYFQLGDSDPFVISELRYKHSTENGYLLEVHGGPELISLKPWGDQKVKIFKD
jgi:hypothetical protein